MNHSRFSSPSFLLSKFSASDWYPEGSDERPVGRLLKEPSDWKAWICFNCLYLGWRVNKESYMYIFFFSLSLFSSPLLLLLLFYFLYYFFKFWLKDAVGFTLLLLIIVFLDFLFLLRFYFLWLLHFFFLKLLCLEDAVGSLLLYFLNTVLIIVWVFFFSVFLLVFLLSVVSLVFIISFFFSLKSGQNYGGFLILYISLFFPLIFFCGFLLFFSFDSKCSGFLFIGFLFSFCFSFGVACK